METCVRGFSFMSDSKVELKDLQYIEGGELERAWRSTRRERMKQREQKIWDEFVKEKDVVQGLCNDDPYQFLDNLPESCLEEMMETEKQKEMEKITHENAEEETRAGELAQEGNGDNSGDDGQHTCVVTFADDLDKDDCDMFHIFDDEQSGPEDETLNESGSPSTVRENQVEGVSDNLSLEPPANSLEKMSSKSSENVTSVIESSIYCAKVKDLRTKIIEELLGIMTSLDRRDILQAESEDISRMVKRSAEFCTRFNRIYMYQLQRQIHDIKRNNNLTLPFAKHTQFQSQMVRILSLHQNLLQSFQVFHKSFEQTCCVRESAGVLGSLLAAVRDSNHMCINVPPPKDFTAANDLYKDEMLSTCDKVDDFVNEYAIRCEEFLNSVEVFNRIYPKNKSAVKNKVKKRSPMAWTKNTNKNATGTESRLSMYSLDNLRINLNPKSSSSKDNQVSNASKMRSGQTTTSGNNAKQSAADKNVEHPNSQRRSSRRPLMRDPHAGRPRAPRRLPKETDIRTMVEAVDPCASSHISREASPHQGQRSKGSTPRRTNTTPRFSIALPKPHTKKTSPSMQLSKLKSPSFDSSPSKPKPRCQSPKPTNVLMGTIGTEEYKDLSQMTPVCKIKCAMKKDLEVEQTGFPYLSPYVQIASPQRFNSPTNREVMNEKKDQERSKDASLVTTVCKIQCAKKKDEDSDDDIKWRPESEYAECSHPDRSGKIYRSSRKGSSTISPKSDISVRSPRSRDDRPAKLPSREVSIEKKDREIIKVPNMAPDRCEVTRLIKQLCSGDASGTERVTGAKNAQLMYVSGTSPRQPSTPQLLRILEETIQKKVPKPLFHKPASARGPDRYRLVFNIPDKTADTLFQYRTKFVQHMLTSSMYANSAVGKPWEMIGSVSEQIIDELLLSCTKEMELRNLVKELYKKESLT